MTHSREEIEKLHQSGTKLKYLFFWGHQPSRSGDITSSCFSQWWNSKFIHEGVVYHTTEHWMMAEKARLFNDHDSLIKILSAKSPGEAKKWGRSVIGFKQDTWEEHRFRIVVLGNYLKFTQNAALETYLLNTKNRVLVEASPVDRIWGIGIDGQHEFATVPTKWKGLNLLGFALMEVRDLILQGRRP